jgi:mannose-6-phosphate isomerase-like protein (cupin superfamily)
MGTATDSWTALGAGEGEALRFLGGSTMRLKSASEALTFYEYVAPPGAVGPPQHIHHEHDETFLVVAGNFEFGLDDTVVDASAGTFLEVPRGVAHTFRNAGEGVGSIVGTFTPGRFGHYFRELADHIERTGAAPEMQAWAALYRRYGTTFR